VRIPLPVVILLCLAVIGGFWWNGTRRVDFLTPPSEEKLAWIRARVAASMPPADHFEAPLPSPAVPPPPAQTEDAKPTPSVDAGDLSAPPTLAEYKDLAEKGASHYTELAVMLEVEGGFQRALLAWERVLDFGSPNPAQAAAAIASIKRLRPTLPDWNPQPATGIPIILQAGTGSKNVKVLEPLLAECARELEKSSSGILRVTSKITPGKNSQRSAANPAPIAIWLTGPAKNSQSTEVLSFKLTQPEAIPAELRKTAFELVRSHLATHAVRKIVPLPPEGSAEDALNSHITRLDWQKLGSSLNQTIEKP
jgi:hypothetical protein